MSTTFFETITLEKITCGDCGIVFALPSDMILNKRREGGSFYCPNGHYRGWSETDADRLRKQLEAKETELRRTKCEVLNANQRADNANSEKLKAEKKLRRVGSGVCPCCNRTFINLQRHMQTKHSKE